MKRHQGLFVLAALGLAILMAGCWGSSKDTSLDVTTAPEPGRVGSQSCINTCHAASVDHITGLVIATTWQNSTHFLDGGVQCEDCHGGGGNHFGVGPIPEPNPTTHCANCHGFTTYTVTAHYNANNEPAGLFSQADAGTGQAVYFGQPEFRPDNVTPVTRAEHVEQCSRCHNPSQAFAYNFDGTLADPNPAFLPQPRVGCGACHDGHDPAAHRTDVTQRLGEEVHYPRFRDWLVDAATGAQTDNAAAAVQLSTINLLVQENGAVLGLVTPDYDRVVGTNNEIHPDRLCAVCHAKGEYLYSRAETHQEDVHGQWAESGHGHRNAAAFAEFSANPPAYTDAEGNPYEIGSHRTTYPWDMGNTTAGAAANADNNASYIPAGSTSYANNYACFKCHSGLGSLAYQDNVEGTPAAPVLFGDVTVTCVTCHDPHAEVAGQTKNTRKPLVMTKYSSTQATFSGNVFLDNTPVPSAAGNATICIFCHQGRESGLTLFKRRIDDGTTVTGSFLNEHYLGTGGMLWARNAYEYGGKSYGEVHAHQQANCIGCHMAAGAGGREDIGGHTWRIFSEADNVLNTTGCNVSTCHGGAVPPALGGTRDALLGYRAAFDTNDYDGDGNSTEGIAQEVEGLATELINLLLDNNIFYNDLAYPYFFQADNTAASFTAWTLPSLKAAFNLQYVIKGLPSSPVSQIGQPNPSAGTHNYRYNIQILRDSYDDLRAALVAAGATVTQPDRSGQPRPPGNRSSIPAAATNYDNPGSAVYNPRQ